MAIDVCLVSCLFLHYESCAISVLIWIYKKREREGGCSLLPFPLEKAACVKGEKVQLPGPSKYYIYRYLLPFIIYWHEWWDPAVVGPCRENIWGWRIFFFITEKIGGGWLFMGHFCCGPTGLNIWLLWARFRAVCFTTMINSNISNAKYCWVLLQLWSTCLCINHEKT